MTGNILNLGLKQRNTLNGLQIIYVSILIQIQVRFSMKLSHKLSCMKNISIN